MSSVRFASCLVAFTFIFNLFLTNESMYIVMMIEKKKCVTCVSCLFFFFSFLENCEFGKNPFKICKPVRNEEPTVRP